MRTIRGALQRTGALKLLDARTDRRWAHWARSQFAIYDFEDLAALDSPWWSYDSIDEVDAWLGDRTDIRAFEWGSGASTIWLLKRVDELISIEHDAEFANSVRDISGVGENLLTIEPTTSSNPAIPSGRKGHDGLDFSDYVNAIDRFDGSFDLICIDGRARTDCLRKGLERLAPGGIVVFDNSDRERYASALNDNELQIETHRSWAPALPTKSSTSIVRPIVSSTKGAS